MSGVAAASAAALIRARGLCKSVQTEGGAEVHALRDVDLDIDAGEFTVLMGSSGSGKSTLLYLLSGLQVTSTAIEGRRLEVDLSVESGRLSGAVREVLLPVFADLEVQPAP